MTNNQVLLNIITDLRRAMNQKYKNPNIEYTFANKITESKESYIALDKNLTKFLDSDLINGNADDLLLLSTVIQNYLTK